VQLVVLEELLPNITIRDVAFADTLVFSYAQEWNGGAVVGARYWMARDVGPVAVAFIANGSVTPRYDAVVSVVQGSQRQKV
jgi:hypothetical protein